MNNTKKNYLICPFCHHKINNIMTRRNIWVYNLINLTTQKYKKEKEGDEDGGAEINYLCPKCFKNLNDNNSFNKIKKFLKIEFEDENYE